MASPQVVPFQIRSEHVAVDLIAERVTTIIPAGVKIKGDIEADEGIQIDGVVDGRVVSKSGTVLVGKEGVINGSLETNGQTVIEGAVTAGDSSALAIRAHQSLILSDAMIQGIVEYSVFEARGDIDIVGKLRRVAK